MKTNRHSPKDSPLDHPTEDDIRLFREELVKRGFEELPVDTDPDQIDFGPGFSAVLTSRLRSLRVRSGEQAISLLIRSDRVFSDFELQLNDHFGAQTDPEDILANPTFEKESSEKEFECFLTFLPFNEEMVNRPLHEYRVFITARQVRAIGQYQYHHACLIPMEHIPSAGVAMAKFAEGALAELPESILDVAIDLYCVPTENADNPYEIGLIEVNPFGPGCVWGVLDWERDKNWLMGKADPPPSNYQQDTAGGAACLLPIEIPERETRVIFAFTHRHAKGFVFGGLAFLHEEYLAEMSEIWKLEAIFDHQRALRDLQQKTTVPPSWCYFF